MATTTVKISSGANRKLDALQARARIQSGKRVTKQTILERLIDRALADEAPVLLNPPEYPLPARIPRKMRNYPLDWGVETREADFDDLLYGGRD